MSINRFHLLALLALAWPLPAIAQVFEIVRELGVPAHRYSNLPPFFTVASDDISFPATPNVTFAISSYSTLRLRLIAPPGKKFVATQAVNLTWPADITLYPVGSTNSGPLHPCPASWSFTTVAGTPPTATVEGLKSDSDHLLIRSTATGTCSANFEFTEVILQWNLTGLTGASQLYTMQDGGAISGPELNFYRSLTSGAPDPGQAIVLQPLGGSACIANAATWSGCGVPMAAQPGPQINSCLVADGAGGAVLAYTNMDSITSATANIWLSRVDAEGQPVTGWPVFGFAVTARQGNRANPRACLDGSGGAFVAWEDMRNDPSNLFCDVYLQHVTSTGSRAPGWPVDGLAMHAATPSDDEVVTGIVSDGAGGAFVLWLGATGARLTRVTGSGTIHPSWPATGFPVVSGDQLIPDGAGGVYVGWIQTNSLRLTRLTGLGAYAPGWSAAGVQAAAVTPATFAFDLGWGASHVNLGWTTSTGDVRASRVTSGGSIAAGWPASGVLVRSSTDPKASLSVMNGGASGEAGLVWREDLPSPAGFQVVAQRLTSAAALASGWPAGGWVVIPNFSQSANGTVRAVPDCNGGMTLAWTAGGSTPGIRALRITAAAAVASGWPVAGVVLCSGAFSIATPNAAWACSDATGGVITAIPRALPGSGNPFNRTDIYAQCVRGDGTAFEGFTANTPAGSNVVVALGPATVTFPTVSVGGTSLVELEESGPPPPFGVQIVPSNAPLYYDVTTTSQFQGPVQICITYDPAQVQGPESGLQLLHYDAAMQPLGWVNVTSSLDVNANVICGSSPSLSPFVIAETDPTDGPDGLPRAYRLLANAPNPFNPTTRILYELLAAADVRLDVLDVGGRLVRTLVNGRVEAGHRSAVWDARSNDGRLVATGVYFYRLSAGPFVGTRRMVLLK